MSDAFEKIEMRSQARIVCAANRSAGGQIVCSPRHHDALMNATIRREWQEGRVYKEQGFVDQFGKFYNRRDAWHVAVAQQQITRRVGGDAVGGGTLYSENLY